MEKYNGWTNRDTWLVMLWLNNDYNNYLILKEYYRVYKSFDGINFKGVMPLYGYFNFGDPIDWNEVNFDEVIEALNDDFSELVG